jgi:hypothetical protein
MPVRVEVVLTEEERERLDWWARRPKSSRALALGCRIVLAAGEGRSSTEIAAELGCIGSTVGRWRGRFARRGFDGLHDEPRPGKPQRTVTTAAERSDRRQLSRSATVARRAAPSVYLIDPDVADLEPVAALLVAAGRSARCRG